MVREVRSSVMLKIGQCYCLVHGRSNYGFFMGEVCQVRSSMLGNKLEFRKLEVRNSIVLSSGCSKFGILEFVPTLAMILFFPMTNNICVCVALLPPCIEFLI